MAKKIVSLLLIILILSLGFGQLLRFELFGIPIYLHDLLVIGILIAELSRRLVRVKRTALDRKTELSSSRESGGGRRETKGIIIFLAGLILSWLYALTQYPIAELLAPSLYTLRLLAYLTLYYRVQSSKISISRSYLIYSGLTMLIIGLLQYLFMPDMRIFQFLGWDDHLSRLTLPHFDPTFSGVMIGLFALSLIPSSTTYSISIYLFSFLAILLTYSRSVWLSLLLTLLAFVKNKLIVVIAFGCVIIATFLLPKRFGEGTNLLRTYSISSRIGADFAYVQNNRWNLLIGQGMNTLILDNPMKNIPNHASGPNNSYLYLLTTTGVLGLVGWGIFMASLYKKSTHKPMLIFFFIASLFNNVMFYSFALVWVLLIESDIVT